MSKGKTGINKQMNMKETIDVYKYEKEEKIEKKEKKTETKE